MLVAIIFLPVFLAVYLSVFPCFSFIYPFLPSPFSFTYLSLFLILPSFSPFYLSHSSFLSSSPVSSFLAFSSFRYLPVLLFLFTFFPSTFYIKIFLHSSLSSFLFSFSLYTILFLEQFYKCFR